MLKGIPWEVKKAGGQAIRPGSAAGGPPFVVSKEATKENLSKNQQGE